MIIAAITVRQNTGIITLRRIVPSRLLPTPRGGDMVRTQTWFRQKKTPQIARFSKPSVALAPLSSAPGPACTLVRNTTGMTPYVFGVVAFVGRVKGWCWLSWRNATGSSTRNVAQVDPLPLHILHTHFCAGPHVPCLLGEYNRVLPVP